MYQLPAMTRPNRGWHDVSTTLSYPCRRARGLKPCALCRGDSGMIDLLRKGKRPLAKPTNLNDFPLCGKSLSSLPCNKPFTCKPDNPPRYRMLARRILCRRPVLQAARSPAPRHRAAPLQRRSLVSAPKPGDGPLMERRPDRELPGTKNNPPSPPVSRPIHLVRLIPVVDFALLPLQMSRPTASAGRAPCPSSSPS